jgi:hypothetical protein
MIRYRAFTSIKERAVLRVIEYQIGQDYDVEAGVPSWQRFSQRLDIPTPDVSFHEDSSLEIGRKVLAYVDEDVVDERCVGIVCHNDFRGS